MKFKDTKCTKNCQGTCITTEKNNVQIVQFLYTFTKIQMTSFFVVGFDSENFLIRSITKKFGGFSVGRRHEVTSP